MKKNKKKIKNNKQQNFKKDKKYFRGISNLFR